MSSEAKKNDANRENWGSRIGYILSLLGMAIGLGAMWRFPMVAAQNGGGAFVLAFFIICILVILAGFGEIGLGRYTRQGAASAFEKMTGKRWTRILGYMMAFIPLGLCMYYVIVIGTVLGYLFYTIAGAPFLADPEAFYNNFSANKPLAYGLSLVIIAITAVICTGGIKRGIEKICKILLPGLFIILVVVTIHIITLPGISEGIEFYVRPDFSQWLRPGLWLSAAGMALFAIGLGPGYLLTFGSYLSEKADIATDFVTLNITQLLICVIAGFVTLPAVILFGLDPQSGPGLVFMVLPKVFEHMSGGMIWMFLFLLALLFAGFSTSVALLEVPATTVIDGFKWSRKKAVVILAVIAAVGAIPCVWSDAFFVIFDFFIANLLYVIAATLIAIYCAWIFKAKRVREEWVNPTSAFKYGPWVDVLYKYIATPALLYFAITAVIEMFDMV
ncbi:MAG: sodium-dependent transporter [Planctomycetaceae bacterium]|nr:sodium-dependent transporter [Planctomycetaceae bacterium]